MVIMSHIQVPVDPLPGLLGNVRSREYSTVVNVLTTYVQIGGQDNAANHGNRGDQDRDTQTRGQYSQDMVLA
jgi:hypothetical protein